MEETTAKQNESITPRRRRGKEDIREAGGCPIGSEIFLVTTKSPSSKMISSKPVILPNFVN